MADLTKSDFEAMWRSRPGWVGKRVQPSVFKRALTKREAAKHDFASTYGKWFWVVVLPVGAAVPFVKSPSWQSAAWLAGALFLAGSNLWIHRKTASWERPLRGATLVLDEVPLVLGGRLRGQLRLSGRPPKEGGARLVLRSLARTSLPGGGGTSRTTEDQTLWQTTRPVHTASPPRDGEGFYLPVDFELPDEGVASFVSLSQGRAHTTSMWTVELHAAPNGVPVERVFEIPVGSERAEDRTEAALLARSGSS